jgi:flagellar assembly protein FliH
LSNRIIPRHHLSEVRKVDLGNVTQARSGSGRDPDRASGQSELERVREEAYREGLDRGRNEARAMGEQQRAALHALIADIDAQMQSFEQTLANEVLSMSLELAKLIVRHSVRVHPEIVLDVVKEAVANLPGIAEQTLIVLNPADAELFKQLAQGDAAFAALPWKIVEDAQMERGGCRLETPSTEIDATLETRWRRVIAALGRDDAWMEITV